MSVSVGAYGLQSIERKRKAGGDDATYGPFPVGEQHLESPAKSISQSQHALSTIFTHILLPVIDCSLPELSSLRHVNNFVDLHDKAATA
jgi:hypothetical protein